MKNSVYLDSTIFSYLFDERDSIKTFVEITKLWWKHERGNYALLISEEVVAELNEGNYPNKTKILETASEVQMLMPDSQITDITQVYIDNYLMPITRTGDAVHLAYASFYKVEFLLTWNCNHLANANKQRHIRIINSRLRLPTPDIVTPLVLFKEKNDVE